MSRFCGSLKNFKMPENGLFKALDLSLYRIEKNRHSFLVKVDQELAGFVLINKVGTTPEIDWNMAEFFIISKYQKKELVAM